MTHEINRFLPKLSMLTRESSTEHETTSALSSAEIAVSDNIPDRYYQDGEPSWPNAPTAHDADNQRRRLVKRLRRFAGAFPGAAELADRLASCTTGNPCLSGACPVCMRAAQRTFVGVLSASCEIGEVVAVSMMSPKWQAPLGHLNSLDLDDIYFAFEDIYGHDYFGASYWIALGLDVSLNDDTQKGHGIFWQAQFYGIACVAERRRFGADLRKNFHEAASETVKRPVHVKACDGTAKALSYALKTGFVRRIAYRGEGITRTGESRKCWRTRKVSLKAKEEVELRLWLDHIGLGGRVLISPWVLFS